MAWVKSDALRTACTVQELRCTIKKKKKKKERKKKLNRAGSEVKWSESHSVVSNSLQPHGLYSPWNSPDQNTGVGSLSKITVDGDCSHEIKRCLLLGRKVMTNLDSILKSRDITLPSRLFKAMVFPVVMYGCESWTLKKAEHWRIDAFKLCCWRRLLRVPRTARRFNRPS